LGEAFFGVDDETAVEGQVLAGTWAAVVILEALVEEALVEEAQRKDYVQEAICTYSVRVGKEMGSVEAERQCSGRNSTGLELEALGVTVSQTAAMILQGLMWAVHRQMMAQLGGQKPCSLPKT